jgi:hypothetical protein
MECAQLRITSGGNASPPTVSFPGAYKGTDPGVRINIYSGVRSYTIPGPDVFTCPAGSGPTQTAAPQPTTTANPVPVPTTTTVVNPVPSAPSGPTVPAYGQCGGQGYSGSTNCAVGTTCTKLNDWVSWTSFSGRSNHTEPFHSTVSVFRCKIFLTPFLHPWGGATYLPSHLAMSRTSAMHKLLFCSVPEAQNIREQRL